MGLGGKEMHGRELPQTLTPQGVGACTMLAYVQHYPPFSAHPALQEKEHLKPEHRACALLPQPALASRPTLNSSSTNHFYLGPHALANFE